MCTLLPFGLSSFFRRRPVWKCAGEAWCGVEESKGCVDVVSIAIDFRGANYRFIEYPERLNPLQIHTPNKYRPTNSIRETCSEDFGG